MIKFRVHYTLPGGKIIRVYYYRFHCISFKKRNGRWLHVILGFSNLISTVWSDKNNGEFLYLNFIRGAP